MLMMKYLRRQTRRVAATVACALAGFLPGHAQAAFTTFETGQVRPLALSPDGSRLYAINTPDNRLEIFDVGTGGVLTHAGAVAVGLEPIAVAARTNSEVWVVNHLSDSVSIVDVSGSPARVTRTLLVGDEPRDIVFAGPQGRRAFITTAHRGQNSPVDPQLTTPGVGRADVWVFDALNLGSSLGGTPLTILTLFGDTPRALAVNAAGTTVYAAVFHSGNRTTALSEGIVPDGGVGNGGLPPPNTNYAGATRPEVGLIVKHNGSAWVDELGRNWSSAVRFDLPDYDVFAIDATANPPAKTAEFAGVGTILYNMVVNPTTGKVYVTNTEARNEVRFEGPGLYAAGFGGTTVQGHLHEARVTVLDGSSVLPRHLNKHINYSIRPAPAGVKEKSLAIPLGMAISSDGATLYVSAFGSRKIGVFDTTQLESNTFVPDAASQITVSGGGPTGLALDETNQRLYVLTRFDNSISVVNTATLQEVAHLPLYNPEPPSVVEGRPFLYDAQVSSSNGEASCGTCHVFGDLDSLAWDLGNPDDDVLNNPIPVKLEAFAGSAFIDFHPMKGPMTTQSLRGMANHGSMHWRGDRTGGNDPSGSAFDEVAAFMKFIVAFEGLLGNHGPITLGEMQKFTDFILQVTYPPNPIRNLDNSLTPDQQAGLNFMTGSRRADGLPAGGGTGFNCVGCHTFDPAAGFFGTDGQASFEGEPQIIKIPHLRNMYQKVGMFGMPAVPFLLSGDNGHKGAQIRGFGFLHDGSIDTLFRFFRAEVFENKSAFPFLGLVGFDGPAGPDGLGGDIKRRQVEQFVLAIDSNLRPIVGQQITLTDTNAATVNARINLLINRAAAGDCDLVVKGALAGEARGWTRSGGVFVSDREGETTTDAALRAQASVAGQERTYFCVPPGSGVRIGIDRDEDGYYDRDELDHGSDPADPSSYPGNSDPTPTPTQTPTLTPPPPTPTSTMTSTPVPPLGCASGITLSRPRLKIGRNLAPAGDERLSWSGQAVLAPEINPAVDGLQFRVDDRDGNMLFTRAIPGGSHWTLNRTGQRWIFKDSYGVLAPGITSAMISDLSSRTPGLYQIKVSARNRDFQVALTEIPVRITVAAGPGPAQCASVAFNTIIGPAPLCKMSASLASLSCR
jgi:YVTN family beta-propeller protein